MEQVFGNFKTALKINKGTRKIDAPPNSDRLILENRAILGTLNPTNPTRKRQDLLSSRLHLINL